MRKLLSAAALSAGIVACAPAPEAVKRVEVNLQRVSNAVAAEPIPSDCGCTAGNSKVPRQVPGGNS